MKRYLLLVLWLLGGVGAAPSSPADRPLDILAARQELEDFLRTTNTRLRDLEESSQAQQKRIAQLEAENHTLRQELARLNRVNPAEAMGQDLKRLADDIREVDKKRLSDNKLTLDKLERLEELLRVRVRSTPPPAQSSSPALDNADLRKYTVEKGDSLYGIVARLREHGVQVSPKAIEQANPGVVWTRLQIGQEIIIPVPKN